MSDHKSNLTELNAEEWAAVLANPDVASKKYGVTLPRLPSAGAQIATAGAAGMRTILEASEFYHAVKDEFERLGKKISTANVLDFGCGWGRITRTFLKDVPASNIQGIDVRPDIISLAKSLTTDIAFDVTSPAPPTKFSAETFDLIVAYSVFSHLPENIANEWIDEFARILKPGGLLVFTTRSRKHLVISSSLRNHQDPAFSSSAYAHMFEDFKPAIDAYDRGEFVYAPTGGGKGLPSETYGEAIIPEAYIKKHWTKKFDLLNFIESYSDKVGQPLIFLRKK